MSNAKPTPTPWRVVGAEVRADERSKVADCDNHIPYVRDAEGEANAALIARAVNAHAELVAARDDAAAFVRYAREFFDRARFPHLAESVGQLDAKLAAALLNAKAGAT